MNSTSALKKSLFGVAIDTVVASKLNPSKPFAGGRSALLRRALSASACIAGLGGSLSFAGTFVDPLANGWVSGTTPSGLNWTTVASGSSLPIRTSATSSYNGQKGAVAYFSLRSGQVQVDPHGYDLNSVIITYTSGTVNISGTTPGPFQYTTGTGTNASSPTTGTPKTLPAVQAVFGLPPTTFAARVGQTVGAPLSPSLATSGDSGNIASTTTGFWNQPWAFPSDMVKSGSAASMVISNFKTIGQNSNANANILGYGNGFATFQYGINGITGTQVGPFVPYAGKANITWNAADGTWNKSASNWTGGASTFLDGDSVTFDASAGGTVAVSGTVQPDALNFNASTGTFTLSGGAGNVVSGTGALTKSGAGTAVITNDNEWTGGTNLSGGTLRAGSNQALGSGTFSLAGGTLASADSAARTFTNAVTVSGNVAVGDSTGTGAVTFSGATNLSGATRSITTVADTTFSGAISNGGITKQGSGKLALSGINTYSGDTVVNAGELKVNGSIASSKVKVNSGAILSGSGVVGGISGAGSINPGNSPGILAAPWIDPRDGMFVNFEITDIKPLYSQATASANDVLRLTSANPFVDLMDPDNEVNVYFNVADFGANKVFLGGFYTDEQADFSSRVSGANFNYFVQDNAGTISHNGVQYSALDPGIDIEIATVLDTANFASGSVNGRVMQFSVVPESSSVLLAACSSLMLLQRRRKKA